MKKKKSYLEGKDWASHIEGTPKKKDTKRPSFQGGKRRRGVPHRTGKKKKRGDASESKRTARTMKEKKKGTKKDCDWSSPHTDVILRALVTLPQKVREKGNRKSQQDTELLVGRQAMEEKKKGKRGKGTRDGRGGGWKRREKMTDRSEEKKRTPYPALLRGRERVCVPILEKRRGDKLEKRGKIEYREHLSAGGKKKSRERSLFLSAKKKGGGEGTETFPREGTQDTIYGFTKKEGDEGRASLFLRLQEKGGGEKKKRKTGGAIPQPYLSLKEEWQGKTLPLLKGKKKRGRDDRVRNAPTAKGGKIA